MKKIISQISINYKKSIYDALDQLNKSKYQCLFVVNDQKKYLGTLTDGDIRRYIVKNKNLKKQIKEIYNKKSIFFFNSDNLKKDKITKIFQKNKIRICAILNKNKTIINFYEQFKLNKQNQQRKANLSSKLEVIIMAGGPGERMKPFTNIFPKCLLPINEETIIDKLINNFKNVGINKIFISVNYKKNLIKSYLASNKNITFLEENKQLGTLGSASLIPKKIIHQNKSIFISNCDTVFDLDIGDLFNHHIKNDNDLTIVGCNKKLDINYGVLEKNKNHQLINIIEKPSKFFLVNTGLYILKMKFLKKLKKNENVDMDTFINNLLSENKKIGVFEISSDKWLDVGIWPEYIKTKNLIENN